MTDPSSPASIHVERPRIPPPWVRTSKRAVLALVLASLPLVSWAACATGAIDPDDAAAPASWLSSCLLSLVGALLGITTLRSLRTRDLERRVNGRAAARIAAVGGFLTPVLSFLLGAATLTTTLAHGRALRRRGRVVRPRHTRATTTSIHAVTVDAYALDVPPEHARAVAAAWRDIGAAEAASVVAFLELADELERIGAPRTLVDAARANADDEVRHAALCYGVARAVDGEALVAAPLDGDAAPARDIVSFACANAIDSCVLEGAAALVAAALAARDDVPAAIREVLTVIARDEARHAAHGLDVVRWCADTDARALDACLSVAERFDVSAVESTYDDGLERWGVAGRALWRMCVTKARDDVRAALRRRPWTTTTSACAPGRR